MGHLGPNCKFVAAHVLVCLLIRCWGEQLQHAEPLAVTHEAGGHCGECAPGEGVQCLGQLRHPQLDALRLVSGARLQAVGEQKMRGRCPCKKIRQAVKDVPTNQVVMQRTPASCRQAEHAPWLPLPANQTGCQRCANGASNVAGRACKLYASRRCVIHASVSKRDRLSKICPWGQ